MGKDFVSMGDADRKKVGKTGIFEDASIPVIGGVVDKKKKGKHIDAPIMAAPMEKNKHGEDKFAHAETGKPADARDPKANETTTLDLDVTRQMRIVIPPIYYWENVDEGGGSSMMTMAFKWRGQNWGLSFPIDDQNHVIISMHRKNLFQRVRETLDVLVHHGDKVFDSKGDIDPRLVNDQEAIRFYNDPKWPQKVAAFNHLCRIAPITREKAVQLGLLDKPRTI